MVRSSPSTVDHGRVICVPMDHMHRHMLPCSANDVLLGFGMGARGRRLLGVDEALRHRATRGCQRSCPVIALIWLAAPALLPGPGADREADTGGAMAPQPDWCADREADE